MSVAGGKKQPPLDEVGEESHHRVGLVNRQLFATNYSSRVHVSLFLGWAAMQRGTIKKLVADKGFGFIAGSERGKDLFFHLSSLQDAEFDSLYEGQEVEYESESGPKGSRASVVRPA